jgi:hypothetical protein
LLDDDALTGTTKTDFTDVYTRPDPRAYFGALVGLEYQIPQRARPVVEVVLDASARAGRPRTVLVEADRGFYARRLRRPDLTVLGLDASAPAVDYALRTGLLAGGWAADLEAADPAPELAAGIAGTGLVVCTGGVGYIGHRTFARLLRALDDPGGLWLVVFVLRVFDYADVAATLAEFGLVTERVEGTTFAQRRFADEHEAGAATADVLRRGLDPTGREAAGWYHADCYITRPAAAAAATPLDQLLVGVPAAAP